MSQPVREGQKTGLIRTDSSRRLIGANLLAVCFAATMGPIMWVMLGEMFPNRMRAITLGLCTAVNWIANFFILLLFPQLARSVGHGWIYGRFAFFALLSLIFVRTLVPEMKGMELEDMEGKTNRTRTHA